MDDRVKLLPISTKDLEISVASRCRISVGLLLHFGCSFMIVLTIFTLLKTIIVDYERSTITHCHVLHIVPSASAVIQFNQSSWKLLTWSHLPLRLLIAWLYWRYQQRVLSRRSGLLIYLFVLCFVLNIVSNIVIAEFGDTPGTNWIHVVLTLSIWITSCCFMATMVYCLAYSQNTEPHRRLSYLLKRKLFFFHLSASVVIWPLYFLHVEFCVPLVYSLFAICEHILMFTNMAYVWTSSLDFHNLYICHSRRNGFYMRNI
ncbi:PREDICTED: post-GPI attachment to proteins factor 2 [Drosophila arizonae]|uniref:Post-GPI attachment to proteins factor 2 n=1 Tax=Drosophila arizonae TaxID=7263 RepID=A0ABM1NTJ4_DROAR|nr:PREDICTED: post-GPI attachment to proteins factor 2 [Drosophila arizonae]